MCAISEKTGLTELVSVVWCLLLLGPYGMSAPTGTTIWVDPCGGQIVEGATGETRDVADLLNVIKGTAQSALNKAKSFADAYTGDTFPGRTMTDVNKDFPKTMFNLDEVWKRYGEPTPISHYHKQTEFPLAENLSRYYGHLQTLAIALEGAVHDMKVNNGKYALDFESLMYYLKQVLCEVHTGIGELGYADKVKNKLMPVREELRDETFRAINDWIVFREYIMYMEYLIQSCEFFANHNKAKD